VSQVKKLYILLCGFEIIPKTISTRDRGGRFIMSEPISAYLLETSQGFVLIDTGINSTLTNNPELAYENFTAKGWHPVPIVLPEHEMLTQLEKIGVRPQDISHVIMTHTHADHTGNLKHFRHAKISIQRLEYEHAFGDNTSTAWIKGDYDFPDMQWDIVEGDWEVMPGLKVISTRGHTPGHQSVVVELPNSGTIVLVADSGDLWENFEQEVLPGESVDDAAALASIRRLKQIAHEREGRLFLGHDPNFIQQVKLAPDYYD
jgi:N-acyl homoserine lactone hydrolase